MVADYTFNLVLCRFGPTGIPVDTQYSLPDVSEHRNNISHNTVLISLKVKYKFKKLNSVIPFV